jgi:hypothetical protein
MARPTPPPLRPHSLLPPLRTLGRRVAPTAATPRAGRGAAVRPFTPCRRAHQGGARQPCGCCPMLGLGQHRIGTGRFRLACGLYFGGFVCQVGGIGGRGRRRALGLRLAGVAGLINSAKPGSEGTKAPHQHLPPRLHIFIFTPPPMKMRGNMGERGNMQYISILFVFPHPKPPGERGNIGGNGAAVMPSPPRRYRRIPPSQRLSRSRTAQHRPASPAPAPFSPAGCPRP